MELEPKPEEKLGIETAIMNAISVVENVNEQKELELRVLLDNHRNGKISDQEAKMMLETLNK